MPIVYIVNDLDEIDKLTKYATCMDFYIPQQGTDFRKLEYIGARPNGMIIISKEQFINGIGSYRTDKAFCYIWDNMDIDLSPIVRGEKTYQEMGREMLQDIQDICNGRLTKAEAYGFSDIAVDHVCRFV